MLSECKRLRRLTQLNTITRIYTGNDRRRSTQATCVKRKEQNSKHQLRATNETARKHQVEVCIRVYVSILYTQYVYMSI